MRRAGMRVRGGNLTQLPQFDPVSGKPASNAAWAKHGMGLFVVDQLCPNVVEMDTTILRDIVICNVVLNDAPTSVAAGDLRFDVESSDMTLMFIPRGERLRVATRTAQGLKSVTMLVDLKSVAEAYGIVAATLPASLRRIIDGREIMMDKLVPEHFGSIAKDVAAQRSMLPSLAPLYYEGKTLELLSAMICQISRRDDMRAGNGVFDPKTLERVGRVKQIIDQSPYNPLDIDALARAAAMNRTKLRSSFKQAYGTTLSDYRATLLLERADRLLKESGATVQQAAHRAGYATASSFIVAYKRHFGIRPGEVADH